jgi:hypothetical protein
MSSRALTGGEIKILQFVFGSSLPYDRQQITINAAHVGGIDNSITYFHTPHYSPLIWCPDFSVPTAQQWTFVHEFGHVWQYYHGTAPIKGWLANFQRHPIDYELNYPYDLTASEYVEDYNIEQQASIVADYWFVSTNRAAQKCTNPRPPSQSDYLQLIADFQGHLAPATDDD